MAESWPHRSGIPLRMQPLPAFRHVDPLEAEAHAVNLDRVAVDHARGAGNHAPWSSLDRGGRRTASNDLNERRCRIGLPRETDADGEPQRDDDAQEPADTDPADTDAVDPPVEPATLSLPAHAASQVVSR